MYRLRAPKNLTSELRALPSRFFILRMCPLFSRGRFFVRPQNALSFFFFETLIFVSPRFSRGRFFPFFFFEIVICVIKLSRFFFSPFPHPTLVNCYSCCHFTHLLVLRVLCYAILNSWHQIQIFPPVPCPVNGDWGVGWGCMKMDCVWGMNKLLLYLKKGKWFV